ncbi:MAG: hypothetical protein KC933_11480 [Myxococcales bacterium]|nr:hypothetical protein [Myxococcales bacterium]
MLHRGALALTGLLLLVGCPNDPEGWHPAFDADATGWLLNVWGPAGDDLYAAGGAPEAGVVMHYDGAAWTKLDLGLEVPLLNWSYGFGPDDITVVGNGGTILHYDGSSWSVQTTTTTEDLWGVWGSDPSNLWAVGGRGRAAGQDTILHYDGATWTKIRTPELSRPNVFAFFKVWGTSKDNVYVVGQRGAVLHYDGSTWTEELVGTSEDLISLWGTSPDQIIIVGGRNNGQVVRWDGAEWTRKSLAPLPGLNGVWMRDATTAHVVGVGATIATVDVATLTYTDASPLDADPTLDFHAIFGDSQGKLTTVGGSLNQVTAPFRGIAYVRELQDGE